MSNQQNNRRRSAPSGSRNGNSKANGSADGSGRNGNNRNGNNKAGNNKSGNNKTGGNKTGGNSKNGGNNDNAKSSNNRRRKGARKKKVDPRLFWGNPELLEEYDPPGAVITSKPAAAVLSLGRPPLSGQQNAAEHYFTAVYDRAVTLAGALAAAGDLIETDEPSDPE